MNKLSELLREQRIAIASLKVTSSRIRQTARENKVEKLPTMQRLLLLRMAESLIAAHKTAKIDDDGYTLDLIEDAMRHVGERLAKEVGDGRSFDQKRLEPL